MAATPIHATPEDDRRSFPSIIGWLSLCLLAAGWGPADPGLRQMWTAVGMFGLASAIGLDMVRRMRGVRAAERARKLALRRFESSVLDLAAQDSNLREIRTAIGEIVAVAHKGSEGSEGPSVEECFTVSYPIEIQPLSPLANRGGMGRTKTFTGKLVSVGEGGVSLTHNLPIETKLVSLSCSVLDGPPLRIVVDLQWRNAANSESGMRYSSGGKIIRCETTKPARERPEPLAKVCLGGTGR